MKNILNEFLLEKRFSCDPKNVPICLFAVSLKVYSTDKRVGKILLVETRKQFQI
jgi:hypothetical protein